MDFRTGKINEVLPLVTIGVLSYNYSSYISGALESLLNQTYPFIELIIIDDKSTEDTPDKIDRWIIENKINCTFIRNDKNLGITKVSNLIVQKATGKYISLFAIDDIMLPEKIEQQVALLEQAGEEYGVCYANAQTMDEDNNPSGFFTENINFPEGDFLEPYIFGKVHFATPVSLIRTSVYKKTGLYDERTLYEDYNFWIRVFALYKVKYCSYSCLIYRKKKYSPIFNELTKNNRERYYRDRILSNLQGLEFIDNKKVKIFLRQKISQYLKALAAGNSAYLKELLLYLLQKGYLQIPPKVLVQFILKNRAEV